jgi:two-component system sensor histidine kinase/response regulator
VLGKVAARPKKLKRSLGLKVLLAHGNSGDQRAIIGILADWGCTVMPTDNAEEAVELMTGDPPDLVLIEDQLADGDGFETAGALRDQGEKSGKRVPVILMTDRPVDDVRELAAAAGMDAYVSKPVDPNRLFKTLAEIRALETGAGGGEKAALFDRAEFMERAGDEVELAKRMLELFFRDTPGLMKKTEEAISAADGQIIGDSAHTLKGMLATLAAHQAAATASRVEDAGREGPFAVAKKELSALDGEIERLTAALKAEFK